MNGCKRKAKIINGNPLISGVRFLFESEREKKTERVRDVIFILSSFTRVRDETANCDVFLVIQTFLRILCQPLQSCSEFDFSIPAPVVSDIFVIIRLVLFVVPGYD